MEKFRDSEAVYVREVRTERWLNVTVSAWLAAIAILAAGWLVSVALLQTGLSVINIIPPLP